MITVSQKFKDYAADPNRAVEFKVEIAGVTFSSNSIVSLDIEGACITNEDFTIGSVVSSKFNLTMNVPDTIPNNAAMKPFLRYSVAGDFTEWAQVGEFFVDSRTNKNSVLRFSCFDALIKSQLEYSTSLVFPCTMAEVLTNTCDYLGILIDSSLVVPLSYMVEVKPSTQYTFRDVLSFIASSLGGSFVINNFGKLQLVTFESTSLLTINDANHWGFNDQDEVKTITKLIVNRDSQLEPYTVGTGEPHNTLVVRNNFATEAIVTAMFTVLNGVTYHPLDTNWRANGILEVGDRITVSHRGVDFETYVLRNRIKYTGGLSGKIEAPSASVAQSEFDFGGNVAYLMKNSLIQGRAYYGTKVTETNGITVERSDGKSDLTLNSDIMRWRVKNELGVLVNKFYFDVLAGDIVYNGKLGVDAIEAIKADIDIVVSNTVIVNQLSAQKGNIAELTVDQLDTSDKVQKYLLSDTSDVDYIRVNNQVIEFVSAIKTTGTSQVEDRHGNLIYWLDGIHEGTTLDVTIFPVLVYNYNEEIKMVLDFKAVNSSTVPFITMGIGNGTGDQMKAKIYKDADGLVFEYLTSTDKFCKLMVNGNGVTVANPTAFGLRNIAVGTAAPTSPQNNDLWIDTDA